MAKWPHHEPEPDPPPHKPAHGHGRAGRDETEPPPEPEPEPPPEPPYVYPGDAVHLQAAIDTASVPVNPRMVRGLKPYHDLTHVLASVNANPEHAEEILMTVEEHLAVLDVAFDAAAACVTEVANAYSIPIPGGAARGGGGKDKPRHKDDDKDKDKHKGK